MQAQLLQTPALDDWLWLRAAIRECIAYGEHGVNTELDAQGRKVCFNCQGKI
jgi:hypothetical protein